MSIKSKIVVGGSEIDAINCSVTNSLGNEQSINEVDMSVNNYAGKNKNSFHIGQAVDVYLESGTNVFMSESSKTNLIGHWAFEDKNEWLRLLGTTYGTSSPVKDSIGNYKDGINEGAIRVGGIINYGNSFPTGGSPKIDVVADPNSTNQNPSDWSISFWSKYTGDGGVSGTIYPLQAFTLADDWSWLFVKDYLAAGSLSMEFYINAATDFVGSGVINPGSWVHTVGTYDSGSELSKLFINSVLVGSLYGTAWETTGPGSISFGDGAVQNDGHYFLDEISIFNKALSNDEVTSLYNNGSGVSYGNRIFSGIVEDINYYGKETRDNIELSGRDWGLVILDKTVQPETYTNLPAGSIIRDIMTKYAYEVNIQEVGDSGTTIDRISFNQTSVYDAIKQLAEYNDSTFYIDETKKLRFRDLNSISSQRTYDTDDTNNVLESTFKERRDTIYNNVWVYGDRYLDGYKETFTTDGGSAYTLTYNPHNTSIVVNSTGIQPGGVYGMVSETTSGLKYLVNYNDRYILFTSGADLGNNYPATGSIMIVTYDRSLPIVKVGDNEASKSKYRIRTKIIQDKSIKDPNTAEMIMLKELDNYSDPLKEGTLVIRGIDDIKVGETALLNIPEQGISGVRYEANEIQYTLNPDTIQSESVMRIKFNKQLPDITDQLRKMMIDMKKLQSQDMTTSDFMTRYHFTTGSFGVRVSGINIYTNAITQSGLYCYWNGGDYTITGTLASGVNQRGVFGDGVGSPFSPLSLTWSGGYF